MCCVKLYKVCKILQANGMKCFISNYGELKPAPPLYGQPINYNLGVTARPGLHQATKSSTHYVVNGRF